MWKSELSLLSFNTGYACKKSNFQFGKFFKDYFKSPKKAKMETIQRNDFGTALLMNGIVLVLSYLIVLSIEGGYGHFGVGTSLLLAPLVCLFVFGFKFLDIFLYGLYVRKGQQAAETAKYSYYMCSLTNRIPLCFQRCLLCFFTAFIWCGLSNLGNCIVSRCSWRNRSKAELRQNAQYIYGFFYAILDERSGNCVCGRSFCFVYQFTGVS